jgi:hypothetical protein
MPDWKTLLKIGSPALTESAVWERVGGDPMRRLETVEGREWLAAIYSEYASVARRWNLPILMFAPTWRANQERSKPGANAGARFCAAVLGLRGRAYGPSRRLLLSVRRPGARRRPRVSSRGKPENSPQPISCSFRPCRR